MFVLTRNIKIIALLLSFFVMQNCFAIETFTDPNKTIVIKADKPEFVIELTANPTTGYTWLLKSYDNSLILPIKHHYVANKANKLAGAGGKERWLFEVKSKGFSVPHVTKIILIYARPWNLQDNPIAKTFTIVTM
jgi:inhibitor of cysteine peptidase